MNVTVVESRTRRKKHEYTLDKLPKCISTGIVEHRIEDSSCPNCGEAMAEIGREVVRTLKLIPAKAVVVEHVCYTMPVRSVRKRTRRRL